MGVKVACMKEKTIIVNYVMIAEFSNFGQWRAAPLFVCMIKVNNVICDIRFSVYMVRLCIDENYAGSKDIQLVKDFLDIKLTETEHYSNYESATGEDPVIIPPIPPPC